MSTFAKSAVNGGVTRTQAIEQLKIHRDGIKARNYGERKDQKLKAGPIDSSIRVLEDSQQDFLLDVFEETKKAHKKDSFLPTGFLETLPISCGLGATVSFTLGGMIALGASAFLPAVLGIGAAAAFCGIAAVTDKPISRILTAAKDRAQFLKHSSAVAKAIDSPATVASSKNAQVSKVELLADYDAEIRVASLLDQPRLRKERDSLSQMSGKDAAELKIGLNTEFGKRIDQRVARMSRDDYKGPKGTGLVSKADTAFPEVLHHLELLHETHLRGYSPTDEETVQNVQDMFALLESSAGGATLLDAFQNDENSFSNRFTWNSIEKSLHKEPKTVSEFPKLDRSEVFELLQDGLKEASLEKQSSNRKVRNELEKIGGRDAEQIYRNAKKSGQPLLVDSLRSLFDKAAAATEGAPL